MSLHSHIAGALAGVYTLFASMMPIMALLRASFLHRANIASSCLPRSSPHWWVRLFAWSPHDIVRTVSGPLFTFTVSGTPFHLSNIQTGALHPISLSKVCRSNKTGPCLPVVPCIPSRQS